MELERLSRLATQSVEISPLVEQTVSVRSGAHELTTETRAPASLSPLPFAVEDCHAYDQRSIQEADLNAAPLVNEPAPAVRLSARAHAACVSAPVAGFVPGGSYTVDLDYRTLKGNPARVCVWQDGPDSCAPMPSLMASNDWYHLQAAVTPEPGTVALRLFVYADAAAIGGNGTVVEYRALRVTSAAPLAITIFDADVSSQPAPLVSWKRLGPSTYEVHGRGVLAGVRAVARGVVCSRVAARRTARQPRSPSRHRRRLRERVADRPRWPVYRADLVRAGSHDASGQSGVDRNGHCDSDLRDPPPEAGRGTAASRRGRARGSGRRFAVMVTPARLAPNRVQDMPPPKVLFIGGSARSGSTIVDRAIGATEGCVSAGEIRFIWRRGFLDDQPCGCGETFGACPFWREVSDVAWGGMRRIDVHEILRLQDRVDRWWRIPQVGLRSAPGLRELDAYADVLRPAVRGDPERLRWARDRGFQQRCVARMGAAASRELDRPVGAAPGARRPRRCVLALRAAEVRPGERRRVGRARPRAHDRRMDRNERARGPAGPFTRDAVPAARVRGLLRGPRPRPGPDRSVPLRTGPASARPGGH